MKTKTLRANGLRKFAYFRKHCFLKTQQNLAKAIKEKKQELADNNTRAKTIGQEEENAPQSISLEDQAIIAAALQASLQPKPKETEVTPLPIAEAQQQMNPAQNQPQLEGQPKPSTWKQFFSGIYEKAYSIISTTGSLISGIIQWFSERFKS